jgi:DNA-binding response OmpR family regulator
MTRILVAEDEPDIRHLIALTLEFNGFEVVSVSDGFEAIEAAKAGGFDLILLDVRMPRITGYDACRQIRELTITKETPIVFLSAKGQESEVEAGLEAGADEYILKPFAPNDLIERINFYLAKPAN